LSDAQLEAAARAALATDPSRARVFEHQGRRYAVKRLATKPRHLIQTLFVRWLVKRITGQRLPMQTLALSEAASSMDFEANRLKCLAAAGVRVPRIALLTDDLFVLEYCGAIVGTLLNSWTPETWRRELPRLAGELGEFHRAGHWHGGAQIKNVTLQDGVSYRIDFEEDFGEFLPLPVTQAADLVLFLNSISLSGPIVESEARRLLPQLIDHYFAANPDPEIKDVIRRGWPLMKRLAGIARPFRRWSNKGIPRVLILVDVFRGYLEKQGRP
jgi:tRNA A-37 threonylcarbamoyl transferase component Bud32